MRNTKNTRPMLPGFHLQILRRKPRSSQQQLAEKMALLKQKSFKQIGELFERFIHQGAEPLLTGSVGLGLAIASRLTGMLGGKLSYRRFAGKTYFIVNLPAMAPNQLEDSGESESVAEVIRAMTA